MLGVSPNRRSFPRCGRPIQFQDSRGASVQVGRSEISLRVRRSGRDLLPQTEALDTEGAPKEKRPGR